MTERRIRPEKAWAAISPKGRIYPVTIANISKDSSRRLGEMYRKNDECWQDALARSHRAGWRVERVRIVCDSSASFLGTYDSLLSTVADEMGREG